MKSYVPNTSLETKRKMSDVLSNITHNNDNFLDSNITHDINNNKPIDNNVPTSGILYFFKLYSYNKLQWKAMNY